jgi:hypothetical protein
MRLAYSSVAAVLLPASLERFISADMPMISRPADLRCRAAAGPGWGLLQPREPTFEILAQLNDMRM